LTPRSTGSRSLEVHDWQNTAGPKTDVSHSLHRKPISVPVLPLSLVILSRVGSIEIGVDGCSKSDIRLIIQGH
jgi:hypothetical protein